MVGATLNHNVACLDQYLALVYEQEDFSLQNDAIIDGLGPMHVGVARTGTCMRRGVGGTDLGEQCLRLRPIHLIHVLGLRRNVQYPNASAGLGGRKRELCLKGFSTGRPLHGLNG